MKIREVISESSLSRLYSKTQNHAVGAISAFRGEFSKQENLKRTAELKAYLINHGYQVTMIDGGFIENYGTDRQRDVTEKTLFVVNPQEGDDGGKLEGVLKKLGNLYDQDSILSYRYGGKPTYIGTTDRSDAYLPKGEQSTLDKTEWGDPKGEYFSSIRGRKFSYVNECYDVPPPKTVNARTTCAVVARSVELRLQELSEKSSR